MKSLKRTQFSYKKSNITILSDICAGFAREELIKNYGLLEGYIQKNPLFLTSYEPLPADDDAPSIARTMLSAAQKTGVGPMASVAGAFSDALGAFLIKNGASDVIVENGGDIFLKITESRIVGIYAGPSRLSDRLAFNVKPEETPAGICTSSNSVGPSISLGASDASTAVADSSALADAAASAIGNAVKGTGTLEKAINVAKGIAGIRGMLVIRGEEIGTWGKLPSLIKTSNTK
ncbi:MAG: UPF0280 family protein [Candidatus Altiarchaeia archaeon]